jgi:hypothetical protein
MKNSLIVFLGSGFAATVHSNSMRAPSQTLMQDRIYQIDETSCTARPDHTSGSKCEELRLSKCGPHWPP